MSDERKFFTFTLANVNRDPLDVDISTITSFYAKSSSASPTVVINCVGGITFEVVNSIEDVREALRGSIPQP